jgi:hypothetical protein
VYGFPTGERDISLAEFMLALGPTHSLIQWVSEASFLRVKWLGHDADHSPPECG